MSKSLKVLILLFVVGTLAGNASADILYVDTGETVNISTTESYGKMIVIGTLNLLSGADVTLTGDTALSKVEGTLFVDEGASLTIYGRLMVDADRDFENGTGAEIIVNGGTIHLLGNTEGDRLTLGDGKDAFVFVYGGLFRVGSEGTTGDQGDTKLADGSGGVHRMYILGGTYRSHRMEVDGGGGDLGERNSNIFVGNANLIVEDLEEGAPSDWVDAINQDNGLPILSPAEGFKSVTIEDYNDGEIATGVPGDWALNPYPQRNAEQMCPDLTLSWNPGPYAGDSNGHDVYVGTDFNDVNEATVSYDPNNVSQGRQDSNTYSFSGNLDTIYYWRVDEVNEANTPDYIVTGEVWSFTIYDGNAFDPVPDDEEERVQVSGLTLEWNPGCLGDKHNVYFSKDFNDVNDMESSALVAENLTTAEWIPPDPCYATDYYWRIIEKEDGGGTYTGPVWEFSTAGYVANEHLLLWYKFDESDGNDVMDSSGREFHGELDDHTDNTWDITGGRDGGSIYLDGDRHVEVPTDVVDLFDTEQITVSFWFKKAWNWGNANWLFSIGGSLQNWLWDQHFGVAVPTSDTTRVLFVGGMEPQPDDEDDVVEHTELDINDVLVWDSSEGANPDAWRPNWHQLVVMKDESTRTLKIYFDGLLAESRADANQGTLVELKSLASDFYIGDHWKEGEEFEGNIDDFRIYDYALSDTEVELLYRFGDLARAWGPEPYNGQGDVPRDVNLVWRPGDYAVEHDVYFGTNYNDVNDANSIITLGLYKGRQAYDSNMYDPCELLELGKTYYWRIDEVNDSDDDSPWKGLVWSFTVANYLIIDNFEDYKENEDPQITSSWSQGGYTPPNCSCSTIGLGKRENLKPVYEGAQSMSFSYLNGAGGYCPSDTYYSETEHVFDPNWDFTSADVRMLTFFFCGSSDPLHWEDPTSQMYLGLKDTGDIYEEVRYGDASGEDINDIRTTEWQEWNVPLTEFTSVNREHIASIFIGFGDRTNTTTPEGRGKVYIDEIRLYPPKCVPAYGPQYDLSGNCIVDYADIAIMAEGWLETDLVIHPTQPNTPAARYEFDETSGNTATESENGGNYNGTVEGVEDVNFTWVTGKVGTGAIDVNGAWVYVPDGGQTPKLRPASAVTITAWIKRTEPVSDTVTIVAKGKDNYESYSIEINDDDDGLTFFVRDVNADTYDLDSENQLPLNEWVYLAGTYDGNGRIDPNGTITSYINSRLELIADVNSFNLLADDANAFAIGARWTDEGGGGAEENSEFKGSIDDVRIYHYALTQAEIAYVMTGSTADVYLPIESDADIYSPEAQGSKKVNLRDYAELMDDWLYEKLWPAD